ncbi:acyltransferase family protein [Flavisolibacter ginsenosidimutans]|uniref:Acyltransferase n=1 Tax=Flavisolibacter ginsenosidimutans TaxID=661481 RepID=A0A5B8UP14_9BACT|nr:acyltransferase [Flavisolibacter ginsenosidimutans]QEC58323.1 acyltransferase [Flavisolibacter ginsenosidimutans]
MIVDFNRRNFGLDLMRATAISFVLVVHLLLNFIPRDFWILWYVAYLGVDVFFVLSGFLIGTLLLQAIDKTNGQFGFSAFRRFLLRRWMRTVPLYYVLLAVNFTAGYFFLNSVATFDFSFVVWSQNLLTTPPHFFGESWSLCVEEWFYILYPFGLFLVLKIFQRKGRMVPLLYTVLFIAAGIITRSLLVREKFSELNIVFLRMDAIAYGVLFAVLDRYFLSILFKRRSSAFGLAGLVLFMAGVIFFLKATTKAYLLYYPLSGLGLGCQLIYLKQCFVEPATAAVTRSVRFLSKISYSVYLNNLVVIFLIKKYCSFPVIWQIITAAATIVVVSTFTFRFIEKYFIALRERLVSSARPVNDQEGTPHSENFSVSGLGRSGTKR